MPHSARLIVCPMPLAQNGAFQGYGYCSTLIGNPMLEVPPTVSVAVRSLEVAAGPKKL